MITVRLENCTFNGRHNQNTTSFLPAKTYHGWERSEEVSRAWVEAYLPFNIRVTESTIIKLRDSDISLDWKII